MEKTKHFYTFSSNPTMLNNPTRKKSKFRGLADFLVQASKSPKEEPLVVEVVHWEDHICRRLKKNETFRSELFFFSSYGFQPVNLEI